MNLTEKTIDIIKATAPIVEENATELSERFYPILFERYPAAKIFFNQAHIRNGTQPRAVAASIVEYANAIDNVDAIKTLISDIVDKHASMNIKPAQYSIVNSCLLDVIVNILGDAGTPEVKSAWKDAIENFASIIIDAEGKKYDETLAKEGGWKGYKKFIITNKVNESNLITSFYLEPADGKTVVTCKSGQYISIMLELPDGGIVFRNYSLSCSPNGKYYRISVKREEDGLVSNYLHDKIFEGDKIRTNPPYGSLYLNKTDKPAVLISGGVGITPMMSILQNAADQQLCKQIYFIHGTPNKNTHAFKKNVIEIKSDHNKDAEFYLCGPAQMMKDLYRGLSNWGVMPNNIIYEYFGPKRDIAG